MSSSSLPLPSYVSCVRRDIPIQAAHRDAGRDSFRFVVEAAHGGGTNIAIVVYEQIDSAAAMQAPVAPGIHVAGPCGGIVVIVPVQCAAKSPGRQQAYAEGVDLHLRRVASVEGEAARAAGMVHVE